MADYLTATLFALWLALLVAAGIWLVIRLVDADIDRATRLPEHPRLRSPHCAVCDVLGITDPPTSDDTARIDPDLIPHDLPRRGTTFEEYV